MLRLEQGFDNSIYGTDDPALLGYTEIHRLKAPALVAFDMLRPVNEETTIDRMKRVAAGDVNMRSATLALECHNLRDAPANLAWHALKETLELPNDGVEQDWRLKKHDDPHAGYPGILVWTATRNLARIDKQGERTRDENATRIRERYSFAAYQHTTEDDIYRLFEENGTADDVMLATATVYAVNKAIAKPQVSPLDTSKYPNLSALHRK